MILPRRRRAAPLLLALLLTAGPLAAATYEHRPHEAQQSRLSITGFLTEAWALVSWMWLKEGGSIDPFGKEGSGVDPFGEAGGSIDPFGKAGSSIDPFGNPTPNPQPPSSDSMN
jgi:hypothetical protein